MKKTIRIIDLLNMISKGEEVPKKIKYRNKIYIKRSDCYWYILENGTFDDELFVRIDCLNDEVEIIEEDKKIEKLEIKDIYMCDDYGHIYINFKNTWNKINEIIDRLNEMEKGE